MLLPNKVPVPNAQRGQTNQNVRVWIRKRFIAGPSKENSWLVLKNPEFPDGFGGEVLKAKLGVGAAGCVAFF